MNILESLDKTASALAKAVERVDDPFGEAHAAVTELCGLLAALAGSIEGQRKALQKYGESYGHFIAATQAMLALCLKAAALSQNDAQRVAELEGKLATLMSELN